jgi:hypothetical protein
MPRFNRIRVDIGIVIAVAVWLAMLIVGLLTTED